MDLFDEILERLSSAGKRNIGVDELDTIARALNVDSIMLSMICQWAVGTGRLTIGSGGLIQRPLPGKRRGDGKGRFTTQGHRVLCTYFPEQDDINREKADWCGWCRPRAGYVKAATETCPETGRIHFHLYLEFPDDEKGKWMLNIWPDVHIDVVRSPAKAVAYVIKDGDVWEVAGTGRCNGPLEAPAAQGQKVAGSCHMADKWHGILYAIEHDDLDGIKERWPHEWITHHTTICKMHAEAMMQTMMRQNAEARISVDFKAKNLFLWGDAGTGKSFIARDRSGSNPYYKLQCKWWDGFTKTNTGIIWNDVVPFAGFNWQTLLDSADEFPFCAETKGGMTAINPVTTPVTVTSNHSIDELFEHATEARKDAFRRRFTVAEVRWTRFGKAKVLSWKVEAGSPWKPPGTIWWDLRPNDGTTISDHELEQLKIEIAECIELVDD
jgi:hypothetical protein